MLYSPASARDRGTLYQLRTLLDRRNVVSDPERNFNACHDFLETVVDGHILAAACKVLGVSSPQEISKSHFAVDESTDSIKSAIHHVALQIEQKYTKYSVSPVSTNDGVFNYARHVLSMGLLARDFMDAWKEGDGDRIMRIWKFFLLHFKQTGHTKYSIEAFRLLARINVTATPKQSYEMKWNRCCSLKNGHGHNRPLDLQMEFFNRVFKDDIKSFHAHLSPASVTRTANAASPVDAIMSKCDEALGVRYDGGGHPADKCVKDVSIVAKTLLDAHVLDTVASRHHHQFRTISQEMFSGAINNLPALQKWLLQQRSAFAADCDFYDKR